MTDVIPSRRSCRLPWLVVAVLLVLVWAQIIDSWLTYELQLEAEMVRQVGQELRLP